jgi:hypothetical protein
MESGNTELETVPVPAESRVLVTIGTGTLNQWLIQGVNL